MLWIKAFHIIFMVTWFAGLFYLPRLFVYHADCNDPQAETRFRIMEKRLFAIMTMGGVLAAVFGFWLLFGYRADLLTTTFWMPLKLALVALLVAYHGWCLVLIRRFRTGTNRHDAKWYRWFNEFPSLVLAAVVLLAVLKPF